jgi:hypothetical protein
MWNVKVLVGGAMSCWRGCGVIVVCSGAGEVSEQCRAGFQGLYGLFVVVVGLSILCVCVFGEG